MPPAAGRGDQRQGRNTPAEAGRAAGGGAGEAARRFVEGASRCGPVREVFLSPFLLVPTRGDAATTRRLAGWAKRWAGGALRGHAARRDTEVTAAEMKARSVLFGDRQATLLARVADRLGGAAPGLPTGTKTTARTAWVC